ncbi:hypothetical protein [Leclercia barmai]|uniref:hypothetical protein n=1 Tax=Leclercia barmai TaxID=2785629 RepID=UPI0021070503|nr:hypothetical protein [Leclercia sp. EMC7]
MMHNIQRGVSLYSFQNETYLGKMTLEEVIGHCTRMGARGIEIIGEQTFHGWPECGVPEQAITEWHRLMHQYDAVPVCHDFMLDYKRYKGRPMPFQEQVQSVQRDIDFAARLGMKFIRSLVSVAPEVLVAARRMRRIKVLPSYWKSTPHCISIIPGSSVMPKHMRRPTPARWAFYPIWGCSSSVSPASGKSALFATVARRKQQISLRKPLMTAFSANM